ncbi:MAG: TonB-dependent receptor plug domain-containing protein [Gemmatimonadetes bacterium]|nr:TonB-dependent receptor plug domain-containing protein [Gemmatimonadota bacterium]
MTACAERVTAADAPRPSSIAAALQGRTAPVVVAPGSTGARIRICNLVGMVPEHPPLYVVNGRKISHNDIHALTITPDQIKEIQILKGRAATDLYGTEAVNGVVLITLKP